MKPKQNADTEMAAKLAKGCEDAHSPLLAVTPDMQKRTV